MNQIILNGLQISPDGTGISRYAYELARNYQSSNMRVEILIRKDVNNKFDSSSNLIFYEGEIKNSKDRIIAEQIKLSKLLSKYDLIHFPDYSLPLFTRKQCIVTIHDVSFLTEHKYYTRMQTYVKKNLMNITIKKAKKLICISKFTAEELIKYYPKVDQDKIEIIYNGFQYKPNILKLEKENIENKFNLNKPYILYVGTLAPHKNIKRLIQAFNILKKQGYDYKLVIAGKKGWIYEEVFDEVKNLQLSDEVIFTGYISEEDLEALYQNCEIFSFISLYEGFGFPPLEAMARGKPILVCNQAAIPEIVGDAGLYCNPYDIEDIAKKMITLINDADLKKNLIDRGKNRIAKFSWDETARKTNEIYEKLLRNKQSYNNF